LNDARSNLAMWWLVAFPGIAIFLTVLAYNLIGEALQEATDPRLREARK
jgi:peptide/nickel transport system permease protein